MQALHSLRPVPPCGVQPNQTFQAIGAQGLKLHLAAPGCHRSVPIAKLNQHPAQAEPGRVHCWGQRQRLLEGITGLARLFEFFQHKAKIEPDGSRHGLGLLLRHSQQLASGLIPAMKFSQQMCTRDPCMGQIRSALARCQQQPVIQRQQGFAGMA